MTSTEKKETALRLKWSKILNNQDYFTEEQILAFKKDVRTIEKSKRKEKKINKPHNRKKCIKITFNIIACNDYETND